MQGMPTMKTESPYCCLSEAALELNCTPRDLIKMGATEKLELLVCVPDGLRVRIYDDYAKSTHIPIFEPEFLSLSVTHCRKVEIHGKTEQMDFREGFQIDPPGHFKHVIPQYGRPDQNHVWLFWRTCLDERYLPKAIELIPDRLFIRSKELQRLLILKDACPVPGLVSARNKPPLNVQPEQSIFEEEAATQNSRGQDGYRGCKPSVVKVSHPQEAIVPIPLPSSSEPVLLMENVSSVMPRQPPALIRLKQVIARTGLSKSTIYDKINPKSLRHDPSFPKQITLGVGSVGWVVSEVDAWIGSRISLNRDVRVK